MGELEILGQSIADPPPPPHHAHLHKHAVHVNEFALTFGIGMTMVVVVFGLRWAAMCYVRRARRPGVLTKPLRREYAGIAASADEDASQWDHARLKTGGNSQIGLSSGAEDEIIGDDVEGGYQRPGSCTGWNGALSTPSGGDALTPEEEEARRINRLGEMMAAGLTAGCEVLVVKLKAKEHVRHNHTVGTVRHLELSTGQLYVELETGARLKLKAENVLPNDLSVATSGPTRAKPSRRVTRAMTDEAAGEAPEDFDQSEEEADEPRRAARTRDGQEQEEGEKGGEGEEDDLEDASPPRSPLLKSEADAWDVATGEPSPEAIGWESGATPKMRTTSARLEDSSFMVHHLSMLEESESPRRES